MAESPTYTTAQIIALAKGATNWYEYAKSGFQHVKNAQDDISALSGGGVPGWNAAIDSRWYVNDTSSSTTTYTGVTNPTATGSDSLFTGYRIFFNPANTNTGASTLNVGTSDGAVNIKKISGGAKAELSAGDLDDNGIYELIFDGTDWLMVADSGFGDGVALNMQDQTLTRPDIKDYAETVNAIGSTGGGTQDIDLTNGNVVTATVDTSANTFTFSNPPASGKAGSFTLILTNGGSQTVNWPAAVDWAGGTAPTLTTSGVDILTFTTVDGGAIWYGFAAGLDMQ